MEWRNTDAGFLLRLSPGEEVIESLLGFLRRHQVASDSWRAEIERVHDSELRLSLLKLDPELPVTVRPSVAPPGGARSHRQGAG
jgi:hypothetical protein